MKKIFAFVLVLGLLLAGCGGGTVPGMTENPDALLDPNPTPEFDAQNKYRFINALSFQETKDFYCGSVMGNHFLQYYDKSSGISGVLCADPSCTHDSPSCGAYVNMGANLSIYNGKRYWIGPDLQESKKDKFLWCSELSGRNRERIKRISFDEILLPYSPQSYVIHRGRLYLQGITDLVQEGKGSYRVTLFSTSLDDSEEIVMLAEDTVNCAFDATARYIGNYIYYSFVINSEDGSSDVTVRRINIDTGETKTVYEEKGLPCYAGKLWVTDAGEMYLPGASESSAYLWKLENGKRKEIISWQEENQGIPDVADGIALNITQKEKMLHIDVVDLCGNSIYSGKMFPEEIPELPGDPNAYSFALVGGDKDKLVVNLETFVCNSSGTVTQEAQYVVALDLHNNMKPTILWTVEK